MREILTYNDLVELGVDEEKRKDFILGAIRQHVDSDLYKTAVDADEYYHLKNPTIMRFQRMIFNVYGKAVPDIWKPNHKIPSNWYFYFITQQVAHLLSNGVSFNDRATKDKLGKSFDRVLVDLAVEAQNGGVSFGFWNYNHVEKFTVREFVPLYDEFTGELCAGIRFWQIDSNRPMMITLYEPDGITEYINNYKDETMYVREKKHSYKRIVTRTPADGEYTLDGGNYASFPIVPLYSQLRQSALVGNQNVIDAYDLIASGLINNTEEGNLLYWIFKNCGGMSVEECEKYIEMIHTTKVAQVDGDEGATVEPHVVEAPIDAHKTSLEEMRQLLFTNFMAVDTQKISAGNTTATEIRAAYEPLNAKNDIFEGCVADFVNRILLLAGIDDVPSFTRSEIVNEAEMTDMVLSAAAYLDDETILRHLRWLSVDEIPEILRRRTVEEATRFAEEEQQIDEESEDEA